MSSGHSPAPSHRQGAILALTIGVCYLLGALFLAVRDAPTSGSARTGQAGAGQGAPSADAPGSGARPAPPSLPVQDRAGTGEHTLPGTVLDTAGSPVAGAVITAEIELGPGMEVAGPGLDTTPVVVAVAGADGGFSLVGLSPGRHRLRVEGEGIFPAAVRFFEVPAERVDLIVARQVAVHGTVVDGQGAPVADMAVRLVSEATGQLETRTDARGGFVFDTLAEGVFQVWAGAGERAAPARRVSRLGPGPFEPVTLTLEPATVVAGRVVDRATGQGVSAAVLLGATDSEEPPRYGRSDVGGNFRIEAVPGGRWTVDAFAPGYLATESIEIQAGSAVAPVISLTRGSVVAGRVVDRRGVPVQGAVVSVRGTDDAGRALAMSEQGQVRLARRFRGLAGPMPEEGSPRFLPRGELGVMLGPVPFPPPQGASSLRFASLLRSPDEGGAAQADALDPLAGLDVAAEVMPMFVTDAQGRFRLTGLPAGRVQVVATHPDYADAAGERVPLGLGQTVEDVTLVLVPGIVLVGTVTDQHDAPVVGATITARAVDAPADTARARSPGATGVAGGVAGGHAGEMRLHAVTGMDGRYRLGPIAASVHLQVTAARHGDATRVVTLAELPDELAERTEDFVLVSADAALTGMVRDAVGFPVRGAVVAIHGEDRHASGRRATTDETGRFYLDELAPGRYDLRVSHADFPPLNVQATTESPAEIALPFGGGVQGEVRDAHTGAAIEGARVSATGPGRARVDTAAAEDGSFTLAPLAAGAWSVQVTAPGYVPGAHRAEVRAGEGPGEVTVRDVRLVLERGATVAGTVRDASGVRVGGARVSAGPASTRTDAEGYFLLRDVPVGETVISAERDGARGTATVPLRPGDEVTTLEITIE